MNSSTATSYDTAAIYGVTDASHGSSIDKHAATASINYASMNIIVADMYVPGITQS
jgi:hypothetical protein